jgi:hypothetical protein
MNSRSFLASHDYDISGLNQDNYDNYDDYYDSYDTHESYHGRREEKLAKKTKKYYCDTCNCECTGEQAYEAHLNGKNHKKKAATTSAQKIPLKALARGRAAYHCEVCNIDCTGADVYQAHVNGQKHQRVSHFSYITGPVEYNEKYTTPTDNQNTDESK